MIERSLFEYLVNTLWQLPLLAAAVWLIVRVSRPSLLAQHLLWWLALSSAVVFPLRGIDWPEHNRVPHRNRSFTAIEAGGTLPTAQTEPPPALSPTTLRTATLHLEPRAIRWLLSLYAVSLAFSLASLVNGGIAARRLVGAATGRPLTDMEDALVRACATHIGLAPSRIPAIRFTALGNSPMVVGALKPVLLLPESFTDLTPDDLTAILTHELAHIRRHDYLANLAARALALPIAWHPTTHALHRRIRQTREMICDAHAARAFPSSNPYAQSLLNLARRIVATPITVEAVGLFDRSRRNLEERIMTLAAPKTPLSLTRRAARVAAGSALLVAATGTAATLHLKPAAPTVFAAQLDAPIQQPTAPPAAPAATVPPVPPLEPAPPAAPQAPSQPPVPAAPIPAPVPAPVPAAEPTPAAIPTPAPSPGPKHYDYLVLNGQPREMTPEERQKLDEQMAAAQDQMRKATLRFNNPQFQQELHDRLRVVDSPDFKAQMDKLKVELKPLDSDTIRLRIADSVQLALDNPAIKHQIEQAQQMAAQARVQSMRATAQFNQRIAAARQKMQQAIRAAKGDPDQIQKAVDQFTQEVQSASAAFSHT